MASPCNYAPIVTAVLASTIRRCSKKCSYPANEGTYNCATNRLGGCCTYGSADAGARGCFFYCCASSQRYGQQTSNNQIFHIHFHHFDNGLATLLVKGQGAKAKHLVRQFQLTHRQWHRSRSIQALSRSAII